MPLESKDELANSVPLCKFFCQLYDESVVLYASDTLLFLTKLFLFLFLNRLSFVECQP